VCETNTYNPNVHPLATSIAVTESKMKPIVNSAKNMIANDLLEKSTTIAAAASAIAAEP